MADRANRQARQFSRQSGQDRLERNLISAAAVMEIGPLQYAAGATSKDRNDDAPALGFDARALAAMVPVTGGRPWRIRFSTFRGLLHW